MGDSVPMANKNLFKAPFLHGTAHAGFKSGRARYRVEGRGGSETTMVVVEESSSSDDSGSGGCRLYGNMIAR